MLSKPLYTQLTPTTTLTTTRKKNTSSKPLLKWHTARVFLFSQFISFISFFCLVSLRVFFFSKPFQIPNGMPILSNGTTKTRKQTQLTKTTSGSNRTFNLWKRSHISTISNELFIYLLYFYSLSLSLPLSLCRRIIRHSEQERELE